MTLLLFIADNEYDHQDSTINKMVRKCSQPCLYYNNKKQKHVISLPCVGKSGLVEIITESFLVIFLFFVLVAVLHPNNVT